MRLVYGLLNIVLLTSTALAEDLPVATDVIQAADLQLMYTKPVCSHEGKSPAWCTFDDLIPISEASGMIPQINAQIDLAQDPKTAKIYVAYFSLASSPTSALVLALPRLLSPLWRISKVWGRWWRSPWLTDLFRSLRVS